MFEEFFINALLAAPTVRAPFPMNREELKNPHWLPKEERSGVPYTGDALPNPMTPLKGNWLLLRSTAKTTWF